MGKDALTIAMGPHCIYIIGFFGNLTKVDILVWISWDDFIMVYNHISLKSKIDRQEFCGPGYIYYNVDILCLNQII